jgi:outer membrane lipoprotein LolB
MILACFTIGLQRRFAAAAIASFMTGCAVSPPVTTPEVPPALTIPQVFIERFALAGRLSIRVGDRLDSVRIEWTRDANKETINFFSPFGSQLAQVSASAEGASLARGDQTEYAPTVGALTQSLLGTPIDTALLARWVQGLDVSVASNISSATGDRLARWTVRTESVRSADVTQHV